MKSKILILLSVAILILGCEDDSELTSPPFVINTVRTVVIAKASLNPGLTFYAFMQPVYGQELEIDSVRFGDSLCTINKLSSFVEGNNYSYRAIYENEADSNRFNSGDSIEVNFYQSGEIFTRSLTLLDSENDMPILIPAESDTLVEKSEDVTITWNKIENADWYGIRYYHYSGTYFHAPYYIEYISTTDTFLTIPGNNHNYDSFYSVAIQAVTGPVPDVDEPDLNSFFISGALYSKSDMLFFKITVGDGETEQ